jgi:hypothetical protein
MADQESPKVEKLLAKLRKQFEQDQADERPLRDEAEKDLRFVAGDQWDDKLKADRIAQGRPALTFARCHTFVQQVSNEARQNKPQVKFIPTEDGDEDTAEVYEGMARHIQYASEAQEAYETSAEYQAGGSFAYHGFVTDYCDDDSFDLELKVRSFPDPFAVYGILMPACFGIEPDHAFVVEEIPRATFEQDYPGLDLTNFDGDSKTSPWIGTETVRVAEYWYVTKEDKEISNPETGETRTVQKKTVRFFKTNGRDILPGSETVWPDYCIPIFPVLGKKLIVRGKPILTSVVRYQRDPQLMLNWYKTRIAETLQNAPIQPYLITEGQIEGHVKEWNQLNTRAMPYLVYKQTDLNGKPAQAPQRQVFEAPIQSLSEAAAQEIDDMKATAGIFDPSLGKQGNSVSGIAKQRDQQQASLTNLHFLDNLERSFQKSGRAMARLIPIIYDGPRMVRILGADETPKIVQINQPNKDGKHYKIGGDVAKYDVVITMGRAFSTKRTESFDMMQQVMQSSPNTFPMWADIFFKNSDLAGSDELAERFKKMLPPQLQDEEDPTQVIPPQVKATLDQLTQQHQLLTQANEQLTQEVKTQQGLKQMEYDHLQKMKQMDITSQMLQTHAKTDSAETIAAFQGEVQLMLKNIEGRLAAMGHDANLAAQEMEGQRTAESQDNAQQHDMTMQATQHQADAQARQDTAAQAEKMAKLKPKPQVSR